MRRAGNLWPTIVSFENLCRAARRAARGKRHIEAVARFLERLEPEVFALLRELEQETYEPACPHTFRIFDPKERTHARRTATTTRPRTATTTSAAAPPPRCPIARS
ncbi:MAG: hypothetical protein AB1486_32750 [Planctomycetota bacterium]